jgi:rhodanese-related sulfurtransferase
MITSRSSLLVVLLASALFFNSCGFKSDIPDLSAEDLKKMIDENPIPVVIDTRTQFEYARGRIPNQSLSQKKSFTPSSLFFLQKRTRLSFFTAGVLGDIQVLRLRSRHADWDIRKSSLLWLDSPNGFGKGIR